MSLMQHGGQDLRLLVSWEDLMPMFAGHGLVMLQKGDSMLPILHITMLSDLMVCSGPPGFVGMVGASRESRSEYQRLNPQFLRIGNGPLIRFNAARDTIFLDATSLFSLHMYTIVPDHLLPIPTWPTNLQGFNTINNLQTSLRNNNISGLTPGHGTFANGAVLAGVIGPVTIWRPPPNRMILDVANDYRPLGVWHWLDDEREAMLNTHRAASQVAVINRYFDQAVPGVGGPGLLDEVDRFFLEQ